jgi:DNA polymerase III sliding clamp (beta) subunit (PCNA family)
LNDYSDLLVEEGDPELIPEIVPIDSRLSISGSAETLAQAFERAVAIAPQKEVIPGTIYTKLSAVASTATTSSYVEVTALDSEKALSAVVAGFKITKPGEVLLPGRKILDILKLILTKEKTLRLDVIGHTVTIRSGRAVWTVQAPAGVDLPPFPDVSDIKTSGVPLKPFLRALKVAKLAAATNSSRFSLMQIQVRNQKVTGCDGSRVHQVRVEELDEALDVEIPIKVVDELIRGLEAADAEFFQLGSNDMHLLFEIGEDRIIAQRLMVGFPDLEAILLGPAFQNKDQLLVNRLELIQAIKRIRVNADPDYASFFLDVTKDAEGEWSLATSASDRAVGNSAYETLDVQYSGSGSKNVCLNHRHLLELLVAVQGEEVVFRLGTDTKTKRMSVLVHSDVFIGICQQMSPDNPFRS